LFQSSKIEKAKAGVEMNEGKTLVDKIEKKRG
jgi:hypothetical protein